MLAPLAALLVLLAPSASPTEAPTFSDATLAPGCDAARATETCPACSCLAVGQTQSADGARLGVIVELRGTRPGGGDVRASHVLIGGKDALAHQGRLAADGTKDGKVTTYEVGPLPAIVHKCVGKCGYDPVGVILPFSVVTTTRSPQRAGDAGPETDVSVQKHVALCFERAGAMTCGLVHVGDVESIERPPEAGQGKPRVELVHSGERTWKLGARGELVLGAYRGHIRMLYAHANGQSLPVATLFTDRETPALVK